MALWGCYLLSFQNGIRGGHLYIFGEIVPTTAVNETSHFHIVKNFREISLSAQSLGATTGAMLCCSPPAVGGVLVGDHGVLAGRGGGAQLMAHPRPGAGVQVAAGAGGGVAAPLPGEAAATCNISLHMAAVMRCTRCSTCC